MAGDLAPETRELDVVFGVFDAVIALIRGDEIESHGFLWGFDSAGCY